MVTVQATRNGANRALLRTLTAATAATLLAGVGSMLPRAMAQTADKTDKPIERIADKKAASAIGEEGINQNLPLKPDYIISVNVAGETDPTGQYTVDQAGNITVRYAGVMNPVLVKGLTPPMAADAIAKFLKAYIKNPQVTVTIVQIPRPLVYVTGAVKTSGPIVIGPDVTLADILFKAELLDSADLSQVRITRTEKVGGEDKKTFKIYKFDEYLRPRAGVPMESENPSLQDKDRIFVPPKTAPGTGVAAVAGEVTHPQQGIPLRNNPPMTIRELINLVGGTTGSANRKSVSIRRPTLDRPLVVDLDKAEQGDLVNNIEVRADDAVYVEKLENNAFINVNGGFVKTGKFVYDKRTTLTQIIMEAGGVAPFSKEKTGRIYRHPDNDPKHTQVVAFDWHAIQDGKAPDIEMQPGDSVWMTPGGPGRTLDVFGILGALTSSVFLYNNFTGRQLR